MSHHRNRPWKRLALATLTGLGLLPHCVEATLRAADATEEPPEKAATRDDPVQGLPAPPGRHFLRLVESDQGEQLQVAIVTYRRDDGATVDLVGAVHIGEKTYYRELRETFEGYDALLFELIGNGRPPPSSTAGRSSVGGIQMIMKNLLDLQFQLEGIDYSKDNFRHADMDPETFLQLSKERGESLLAIMMRAMKKEAARQRAGQGTEPVSTFDLLRAFLSPDRAMALKKVLARQLQDVDASSSLLGDSETGSVILTERNRVAIAVLREVLEEGKKDIGIFYGAAHLPDLHLRLVHQLGFEPTGRRWLVAWDMTDSAPGEPAKTLHPTERF